MKYEKEVSGKHSNLETKYRIVHAYVSQYDYIIDYPLQELQDLISAAKELSLAVPLVVRLEGTNVALGKKLLSESGLKIISADDLADAASKAVAAAKGEEV